LLQNAPGRDTGAGTRGFMDSSDDAIVPRAKRIGCLLVQAFVPVTHAADSVLAR
jgi:hypothetical protein